MYYVYDLGEFLFISKYLEKNILIINQNRNEMSVTECY